MADENPAAANEPSRSERMARVRRAWRARLIALGVVAVLAVSAGGVFAWRMHRQQLMAPPRYIVVIGESVLEDGTKTAGAVAVIERAGDGFKVKAIDTAQKRQIPGTSFDRLRDALTMGGPELVARLIADDIDNAENPAWLLLDQKAWAGVLEDAGGVSVTLAEPTTAFTGEVLYRFDAGTDTLRGDEAAALLLAADTLEDKDAAEDTRELLGMALGEAVVERPDSVRSALADDLGEYSGLPEQLENFLRR